MRDKYKINARGHPFQHIANFAASGATLQCVDEKDTPSHDLNALLRNEPEAKHYFDTLPDYTREQISTRSDSVNSFVSLKDYA